LVFSCRHSPRSVDVALLTVATLCAAFAFLFLSAGEARALGPAPGGLAVDHATEPGVIEDASPTFGWRLESHARGVVQTGYEIQVAESAADLAAETDVWDSDRVTSAESVEAPYAGPHLASGDRYFWRVRVWDGTDQPSDWSEPSVWEMGIGFDAGWDGAEWIRPKAPTEASGWSDYRLDVDFTIASGAAGVVFRERDPDDLYMWQINIESGEALLRPHVERNGVFHILDPVPLGDVITPGTEHDTHHLEILVEGSTITTSIDGTEVDEREDATFAAGAIGFRSGSNAEDASFSGLEVHDAGGAPLFSDDFSSAPDPAFPGAAIAGGALRSRRSLDLISAVPTAPLLRKPFTLDEPAGQVASARVRALGVGLYEMTLSGAKVGDRVMTPPVTDYSSRLRYQTYDVGSLLRDGENVLGMTLAEGYGPAFSPSGPRWLGPREAKAMLEVRYDDGSVQHVATDPTWRWGDGPVLRAGIYAGETYDAQLLPEGWDEPGFDDSGWSETEVATPPGGRLEADTTPPIRVLGSVAPIATTEPEPGTYVFDLGEEISGWARLRSAGPSGTPVRLRYAEDLLPDGHIDPRTNSLAESTDTFVLGGSGATETFEPSFTYHGFRYIEVTGLPEPPEAETVVGRIVRADLPQTATFESSDPLLDSIFAANQRTMRNNQMSYPTDNPVRNERTGPGMDIQAYGDAAVAEFGADRFLAAYLQEIGGSAGSPDMNAADIPLAWDLYRQYGDRRTLERAYPGMLIDLGAYESAAPGLVWPESNAELTNGFGDWCPPVGEPEADGGIGGPSVGGYFACFSEVSLVDTALAYRDATIAARTAAVLGDAAEATNLEDLAARIDAAFEEHFATADGYGSGRQVTSVLPLAFGMVPPGRKAAVGAALVERVLDTDDGHLDTGIFGTRFLIDALVEAGRPDVAMTVLEQTTYPGFGYELGFGGQIGLPPGHGATTDWEEWTYASAMESHDHAMFSGLNASLLGKFAGIEATGPGYSSIRIAPTPPPGLARLAASIQTVRGPVASSWRRSGPTFSLDVVVPPNAAGEVEIPIAAGDEVHESGRPVAQAPDVSFVREEADRAIYAVGSGDYHFTAGPPPEGGEEEGGGEGGSRGGEKGGGESSEGGSVDGGGSGDGQKGPMDGGGGNSPGSPGVKTPPGSGGSPSRGSTPPPDTKASASVGAGGRVRVTIVCVAHCPSGSPKVTVVAAGPSGRPVYARVSRRFRHRRIAFGFSPEGGSTPRRLRLAVAGLGPRPIVLRTPLVETAADRVPG
jgi:alpha-L-rhamnosidase